MDAICGSWKLKSFRLGASREELKDWGGDASGLLIYSPGGAMSVSINRNLSNSEDSLDDLLFYSGSYVVDGEQIIHQVTHASSKARIGTEMIRDFKLEGSVLTLTGTATSGKYFELVWVR